MNTEPPKEIEVDWNLYRDLRCSGLKKQANKVLLTVVKKIENIGSNSFKDFLYSLCEQGLGKDYIHKIQHPIFLRCILPLLVAGVNENSAQEIIYVVKANASGFSKEIYDSIGDISNRELLRRAELTEPENKTVTNLLLADYIQELYFGAHHLPDTLITDIESAKAIIKEASEIIVKNEGIIEKKLVESYKYYSDLYNDYSSWNKGNQACNFSTWCKENKKEYSWVKAYYY